MNRAYVQLLYELNISNGFQNPTVCSSMTGCHPMHMCMRYFAHQITVRTNDTKDQVNPHVPL